MCIVLCQNVVQNMYFRSIFDSSVERSRYSAVLREVVDSPMGRSAVSRDKRAVALELMADGCTVVTVAERLHVSQTFVRRLKKRVEAGEDPSMVRRSGRYAGRPVRKCKTTITAEMAKIIAQDPKVSISGMMKQLSDISDEFTIPWSTCRRWMNERTRPLRQFRTNDISEANKKKRV